MLKKGSIGWAIWNFVVALLLITAGVLAITFSGNDDFQNVVILIIGILVIVDASFRLLFDVIKIFGVHDAVVFKTDFPQAVAASMELAAGIILIYVANDLANAAIIFQNLGMFLGILLITVGGIGTLYALVFFAKKIGTLGNKLVALIGSLILIGGGIAVVMLIGNDAAAAQGRVMLIFLVFIGLSFIFSGLSLCAGTFFLLRGKKEVEKVVEEVSAKEEAKEESEKPEEK